MLLFVCFFLSLLLFILNSSRNPADYLSSSEFYGAAGSPRIKALAQVFPLGDGPLCKHGKVDSEGLNGRGGGALNVVTITLKKTNKRNKRNGIMGYGGETNGFGIGFPFDRERKHTECQDRRGRATKGEELWERKCR